MKTGLIQQEILLMINTSFSEKQLCDKDSTEEKRPYLISEQLEDACWNGMLSEILPGIVDPANNGNKLFLWHVKHQDTCIELELGEYPQPADLFTTINPQGLLMAKNYN